MQNEGHRKGKEAGKRRFSNTAVRFPMAIVQITCIYRGFGRFSLAQRVQAGVPMCARTRKADLPNEINV